MPAIFCQLWPHSARWKGIIWLVLFSCGLQGTFWNFTSVSPAPNILSILPSPCLVGVVVRHLPRERKILGWNPACAGIFSGSSHTSDLKIGTPVATLPGAWRYRVSTWTSRPSVSILWLGEMESWICNFCLSVAARKIVRADPSLRYTRMLLGR